MSSNEQHSKKITLASLAEENGLAIVVVDENSETVAESNNNSMCRVLYSSAEFAPSCAEFCGRAFKMATEAGRPVEYECYAGLNCSAVPISTGEKKLAAITGRAFLKTANYRRATERAIKGDWSKFSPDEFFATIHFMSSAQTLEKTVRRLEKLTDEDKLLLFGSAPKITGEENLTADQNAPQAENTFISGESETDFEQPGEEQESQTQELARLVEKFHRAANPAADDTEQVSQRNRLESEEPAVWRSLFGSLLRLNYRQACESILDFLHKRYELNSMMWLERRENSFETILATGLMEEQKVEIGVALDDERLLDAATREISLELRERQADETAAARPTINLFPVAVGGEIRSALVVGDEIGNNGKKRRLAHFCHTVASELEILRLREELVRRSSLTKAVQKFNEGLKNIDQEDFWLNLTQISAELLRAERASLLVYDKNQKTLHARAAVGGPENLAEDKKIGERIARQILQSGEPLVAASAAQIGISAALSERNYKTDSFIVFPIVIGNRKLAALNFTDRVDGESFNKFDLELLQAITPQIAVALDRADLKDIAGEMEQRSVTDPLTGLLNRRYLDERLMEEIKRSNRYGYPMSFILIDIDDFGRFNKDFGVLVGDEVLRQTVDNMISNLRSADVAARYGGEEFCVLLPQTNLNEAFIIAERIRRSIEAVPFPHRQITVSIGVTNFSHEVSTPETVIKTADDALRSAKQKGKNNVQVFGELNESFSFEPESERKSEGL